MTLIYERVEGAELLQDDLENIDFLNSDQEGVLFNPTILDGDTINYACFSNTHHPQESDNVSWVSCRLNWERLANESPSRFQAIISLYGIQVNGEEELIGEKIYSDCPTTDTLEDIIFDLKSSRGHPPVRNLVGSAPTGKIQLNLPFRYQNLQSIVLYRNWLPGWPKRRRIPLTGNESSAVNNAVQITIAYNSNMNSDFSDIRFVDSDGATQLCHYRESYTAGSTATFWVFIPITPSTNAVKNIFVLYGNSSATSLSNGFNAFPILFEDWEDGKYTGRTSPYVNWNLGGGTISFDTSSPLMGTTSIKHTGNGSNTVINRLTRTVSGLGDASTIYFKFKATLQGSATYAPYFWLWIIRYQDSNNFLYISTHYWPDTNKQVLRLGKVVAGTQTTINDVNWLTGKLPTGTTYNFRIKDTGKYIAIYINGSLVMSSTKYGYTSVKSGSVGFGANYDSTGEWDNLYINPYMSSYPSVGTLGSEETTQSITPDTALDDDMSIYFTVPSDWSPLNTCYFQVQEWDSTPYITEDIQLNSQSINELGYDNIDRYIALRQKVELWANSLYNVRFNFAEYAYEV